MIKKLVER
jgi:hypothetical protein